jgi:lipoyl(octanoyl) transferase
VRWLGRVPYARAVELQDSLVRARREGVASDTLLLLEHPPVITLGRGGDPRHLLADGRTLARKGIELHASGRGGDATYHGPGQLVGYPILALEPARRDAHRYLRDLEEALIRTVADFGVGATRSGGLTGVWVGRKKLGAIGVRLSTGWVTSHGFALNVDPDLDGFSMIVPCGIHDRGVTSLAEQTGAAPGIRSVAARAAVHLADVLKRRPVRARDASERLPGPATENARQAGEPSRGARAW